MKTWNAKETEQLEQILSGVAPIESTEKPPGKILVQSPKVITAYEAKLLQEIISRKTELETVTVRCLRELGVWEVVSSTGQVRQIKQGVLTNAVFDTEYHGSGCGGHYTGYAKGGLLLESAPKTIPKIACNMSFSSENGQFYFREKSADLSLTSADYLILMEKCRGVVVQPN